MFANLMRVGATTVGTAAVTLLLGCATAGAQSVTIGQGGSYDVPVIPRVEQTRPYALTGDRDQSDRPAAVAVYQSYGQAQLVIPSPTR